MGGCRNRSGQIPFVSLRPLIVDVEIVVPVPGSLAVNIIFNEPMFVGALPSLGTFTLTSDGVPLACTPAAWVTPLKLGVNTTGNPPAVSGFVRQNVLDPNCYSAKGTYARPQTDLQWFP